MSALQLTCPVCDAVLRLASAPVPGSRSKCPRCGTPFSLDAPGASPPPVLEEAQPACPDNGGQPIRKAPPGAIKSPKKETAERQSRPENHDDEDDAGDTKAAGLP
jgi:hypothetical protein